MKEVHLQVTEFWQETNYVYLAVGILLMVTAATGFVVVIVKNRSPSPLFSHALPCPSSTHVFPPVVEARMFSDETRIR